MFKQIAIPKVNYVEELFVFCLAICVFSLSGLVCIPLPFSPVPIVIQVNIAVLYGFIFGSKRAVSILLGCYFLAALNVPMFAAGATSLIYLIGPTGGYLAGYILASFVMGRFMEERNIDNSWQLFKYLILANLCVYALGLPYLSLFTGLRNLIFAGLIPFMPGMILKNIFIAKIYFATKKLYSRKSSI